MRTLHDAAVMDLAGVDWAQAWGEGFSGRSKPADSAKWDRRARTYAEARMGDYERAFIKLLDLRPGQSVLDFGCGPGLLAIPLAKAGVHVVACDFSAGMLDELKRRAAEEGVADDIEVKLVAWDDDWASAGIAHDSVDVAIASRSIATHDMAGALRKLDATARERVVVSLAAGHSPRRDDRAWAAVGRVRPWVADHAYCMGILFQLGVYPQLSYIVTHSRPAFASIDEAVSELGRMLSSDGGGQPLNEEELKALEAFVREHYNEDPLADDARRYASDRQRDLRWACVSWGAGDGE